MKENTFLNRLIIVYVYVHSCPASSDKTALNLLVRHFNVVPFSFDLTFFKRQTFLLNIMANCGTGKFFFYFPPSFFL